jgi:hypothetical protein
LHCSCDESLREEETREPEDLRLPILNPSTKKQNPFVELQDPRIKRLKTEVAFGILPRVGNLVQFNGPEKLLDFRRHNLNTFDGLLEIT